MKTRPEALPLTGLGFQDGEGPQAVSRNLTTTSPPSILACAPSVPHPCLGSNCLGLFSPTILGLPLKANFLLHSPPGLGWQQLGVLCGLTGGAPGRRDELRLCLGLCRSDIQRKKFKLWISLLPSRKQGWHVTHTYPACTNHLWAPFLLSPSPPSHPGRRHLQAVGGRRSSSPGPH